MPIASNCSFHQDRRVGFALLAASFLFFSHAATCQESRLRSELLLVTKNLATEPAARNLYDRLKITFPRLHSIPECRTLTDTRWDVSSVITNRVSVAIGTNKEAEILFLRPETIVTNPQPYLRHDAPIILIAYRGKLHVFDTKTVAEFSQGGSFSFHGYIPLTNAIPSLVVSVGPVGSANMMWFYRFDFAAEQDGGIRITPNLLADVAHVMDFQVDADRLQISVTLLTDKWNSSSQVKRVVSLASVSAD